MYQHTQIQSRLGELIRTGHITLGGNATLKIYGTLDCRSGKKMQQKNRVFFSSGEEAVAAGFRPCGNCMKTEYLRWKMRKKRVE